MSASEVEARQQEYAEILSEKERSLIELSERLEAITAELRGFAGDLHKKDLRIGVDGNDADRVEEGRVGMAARKVYIETPTSANDDGNSGGSSEKSKKKGKGKGKGKSGGGGKEGEGESGAGASTGKGKEGGEVGGERGEGSERESATSERGGVRSPSTPGGLSRASSLLRPSIYKHKPETRKDELEEAMTEDDLFSTLKSSQFDGVFNVSIFLFLFTLAYNLIRNVRQKGSRFDLSVLMCDSLLEDGLYAIYVGLSMATGCTVVFVTMWLMAKGYINTTVTTIIYVVFQIILIVWPIFLVSQSNLAPLIAMIVCATQIVYVLKLHSYFATNLYFNRVIKVQQKRNPSFSTSNPSAFPNSVTIGNFLYFLAAPTLVYETSYPRTQSIRWIYVLKKLGLMLACVLVQLTSFQQFMLPVLEHDTGSVLFDMMKLGLPSFIMWIAGFVCLFHCFLNITAEVLKFADRRFFEDWWNCTTIDGFWRKWNIPVHEWCLRHVYIDSMYYYNVNKMVATLGTFAFSAVFHELIFAVGFRVVRPWFFLGILGQIPLIYLGRRLKGKRRGNLLMWWTLFAGQPMLEVLYFRLWFDRHDDFFCIH
uniref:O-acyltransferase n=1 Tax=Palpitomonas bilix TaxID=652834 RepID=A0A7S3CW48_9EUKA